MPWLNVVLLLFAILNVVMGLLGFLKAHSIVSVIAGTLFGVVILASIAWAKVNPRAARIGCLVVCLLELGQFAPKYFEKQALYPAGIMFFATVLVVICLGMGHMMGMRAKKTREAAEKNA